MILFRSRACSDRHEVHANVACDGGWNPPYIHWVAMSPVVRCTGQKKGSLKRLAEKARWTENPFSLDRESFLGPPPAESFPVYSSHQPCVFCFPTKIWEGIPMEDEGRERILGPAWERILGPACPYIHWVAMSPVVRCTQGKKKGGRRSQTAPAREEHCDRSLDQARGWFSS
ncbi:MAG: hypothetical protein MI923_19540 [Phycisphaerales bacterium]|nr:hypothetical protein [Phycisphaerales bacterium]